MRREYLRPRTTLLVVALFLTTAATQAVFAQIEGHSSMEVDFGILGTDGSCDDSSDEYRLQEAAILPACLLIDYQATSNARLNLSVWSNADPGVDLQSVELIVTPNDPEAVRIVPTYLLLHDDMEYGISQLYVRISGWNPLSEDADEPTINSDSHTLVVERPDSDLTGTFTPKQDGQTIQIAQSASLEGVLAHSNSGTSSVLALPVLLLGDEVLAVSGSYSLRPGVTESRQVSFHLPSDVDLGSYTLTLALVDAREADSSPLWQRDIEVTVMEPFGSVIVARANWDVTSFDANTALGTYPGDAVQIQLNLTNPGSLPASSALWVNFESEPDCWPVPLGDILLEPGETRTSTYPVPVPQVEHGTTLDASLMRSSDCSADEQHVLGMEQIHVDDWPVAVSARVLVRDLPVVLDDTRVIPVSFNVTNLENRRASGLVATLTMSVLGQSLGNWTGPLSLEANQTQTFQGEVSTPFCYDGDVDTSIEIRDSHGEMIHTSVTQDSIRTQFIEGEFDLSSTLVSDETVSLGMPTKVQTQIHAEASNPGGCTLLIPLYTIFESSDVNVPSTTNISLIKVKSGQSVGYLSKIRISASSGTYQVSQYLMRSFSNDTTEDDWLESVVRFAAVEVTPSDPDFDIACDQVDIIERNELAVKIQCDIESHMPARVWLRIGSEIGDSLEWKVPITIDPYDKSVFEFSRTYRVGIDSTTSVLAQILWDGGWVDAIGGPLQFSLNTEHPLDGHEPLTYGNATTTPAYPKGGDPFSIQFWAKGSSNWLDGSYQITLWLDPSKSGPYYSTTPLPHGLGIGEPRLIEMGFESWPHTCGKLPYEIIAKDSEGGELDRIEGHFDGCTIELPDLSLVGLINLNPSLTSCVAIITVENAGSRHYTPDPVDQADVTLIIDGMVSESDITIPPLKIGETTTLEVGIPTSGFQELRIILDGQRRHSELDRSNNGLGWSSTTGHIEFENDTDFDGLPDLVEEAGYLINILATKIEVASFMEFIDDPANHTAPSMTQIMVYPSHNHHDSDDDGLSDYLEWLIGTNATNPDTDGDQYLDEEEYRLASQDPLMIELGLPVIEALEPSQTLQPVESELKSGIFTRQHTREFSVEDRNLEMVYVRVVRPNSPERVYVPDLVRDEGDIRYYVVTYEAPWLGEFFVNVTATDSFHNGNEFQIASQDSIWERATNKINSMATDTLLGKIASPVLGFMTGLVYGLKDIVDFTTGVVRFIMDAVPILKSLMDVIKNCTPELQRPIQFPSNCPINLKDIIKDMFGSFVDLSPYNHDSPAHAVFLIFAALGYLTVDVIASSWAVKAFNKVRSVSKTIDNIATGIGRIPSKVVGTLSDAIGSVSTSLKSGIPLVIMSAATPAFIAMKSGASTVLKTLGATISGVLYAVFYIPTKLSNMLDDVIHLLLRAKTHGSMSDVLRPAYYTPLLHKSKIMAHMDSDEFFKEWAKYQKNKCYLTTKTCKGQFREFITNSKLGAQQLNFHINFKFEIDAITIKNPSSGKPMVSVWDSKQGYIGKKIQTIYDDLTKKGDSLRPLRDKHKLQEVCPPVTTSVDHCKRLMMGKNHPDFCKGLTEEVCDNLKPRAAEGKSGISNPADADILAQCILGVRECDWEIRYDISGLAEFQPCMLNPYCSNYAFRISDEGKRAAFISAVDRAEDIAGSVYPPLAGGETFSTQSSTFNYPPVKMGLGNFPVIAAIVLMMSTAYLLNWRKLHPKNPKPSA